MVEVEVHGLALQIPLKPRMHVDEFLAIADKVESMAGHLKESPAYIQPPPREVKDSAPIPLPEKTDTEVHFAHIANQVNSQMEHIKAHQAAITKHEAHIEQILKYLHSLDKQIRK